MIAEQLPSLALVVFLVFSYPSLGMEKLFEILEDSKLVGYVIETLITETELSCGLRCMRNSLCRSFNRQSDRDHGNMRCELSNETRQTSPNNLRRRPGITYFGTLIVRGWYPSHPAHSCKHMLDCGDSKGDGEYWIDPEKNGNPLKVYCDMTTDGGGWLRVTSVVFEGSSAPQVSVQTTYRGISGHQTVLTKTAMNHLRTHLGFTQLRFHCRKQKGFTFHVTTAANDTGEAVVQYFSGQRDVQPLSCGSFVKMEGDNSRLTGVCEKWGKENGVYEIGKWGYDQLNEDRLYNHAVFAKFLYHWVIPIAGSRWECDDFKIQTSAGDFWKVFVR